LKPTCVTLPFTTTSSQKYRNVNSGVSCNKNDHFPLLLRFKLNNNFFVKYFRQDQLLNSTYSQSEFTLDEGEKLLKEMQDLREDLSHYSSVVEALMERSREVVPLKQRRKSLRQPITVTSICNYKQVEVIFVFQFFFF